MCDEEFENKYKRNNHMINEHGIHGKTAYYNKRKELMSPEKYI